MSWGQNIKVGAKVTSYGRHGVGQPAVKGTVTKVDGQDGNNPRSASGTA